VDPISMRRKTRRVQGQILPFDLPYGGRFSFGEQPGDPITIQETLLSAKTTCDLVSKLND
jgi:hypothetical protein